ncbi:hypothetical protein M8J75_011654 [Diaphorina citri]|nr:hypothetical protein M8J75_011654 [Diaphorina citri]
MNNYFDECEEALTYSDMERARNKHDIEIINGIPVLMQKCFSSIYFKGCLDTLRLGSETKKFQSLINYIGKRTRGFSH